MPASPRFTPVRTDIIRASSSRAPSNLTFPIQDNDYGILFMFRDYQYRPSVERGFSQIEREGSSVSDTIFLPLPSNISDTFQVRVQRFDQEIMGEITSTLLSELDVSNLGIGSITGTLGSAALRSIPGVRGDTLSEIGSNLSSDLAFLARRGIDSAFPNQGRNIDAGTGTYINPKAALSFEGVEMKQHSFDWTLAPKNEQESNNLRSITDTFKRNMLPQYVNTSILQRAMFKYPSMVDIFFVGIDSNYYFHFKTAMIQTFSSNFSSNGNAVLRGGRPAAVNIQIGLIESDIHTAEDYGAVSNDVDTSLVDLTDTDSVGRIRGGL